MSASPRFTRGDCVGDRDFSAGTLRNSDRTYEGNTNKILSVLAKDLCANIPDIRKYFKKLSWSYLRNSYMRFTTGNIVYNFRKPWQEQHRMSCILSIIHMLFNSLAGWHGARRPAEVKHSIKYIIVENVSGYHFLLYPRHIMRAEQWQTTILLLFYAGE